MKNRNRKLLAVAVFSISFAGVASAKLTRQIDSIINQPSQKKVRYSVAVVEADSGETVYSHNAKEGMIPASNMKVIITAASEHPEFGGVWKAAFAYYNPKDRLDFSDTGELMYILELGEMGFDEFRERYLKKSLKF